MRCSSSLVFITQIKICTEYRDMLLRPRLFFQEPGLRQINWSPRVPGKSSRSLGSMSRYSAQFLICFIAYIFHFFYSSVGLVGEFAGLSPCAECPLLLSIVIRMRLVIRQSKLPACLVQVQLTHENTLAFMPQDWWNWQVKWIKSVSMRSYQYRNQVNGEGFCIPVSNFTVFQPRI